MSSDKSNIAAVLHGAKDLRIVSTREEVKIQLR